MEKKKDYSLFKILCIPVLLYLVLTWIIPTGSFSGGEFVKGDITPLGLYGLFVSPVYSFAVFAQYIVLILCVGGFYGVLNKTGAYQKIVDFFASKNKVKFLIATVCIFALVTSLFGETMLVFILLPFFVSVLLKLGYDKVSSIAATVGATLIGTITSISGNMAIYKAYFSLDPKLFVLFNIIMLIVFVFLLCMLIISNNVKGGDNKKLETVKDIPLYESVKNNKKSVAPLIVILIITLLLIILGSYNWYYSFGVEIFTNLHEKISSIELFGVAIFNRIFGDFSEIGYFSNYDLSAILLIASVLIAWVYSVSLNDFIEGFKKGVKDMLLPGIYIVLASVVFSEVVTSSANISLTISNYILNLSSNFNIFTGTLTGILGSLFYNDYLYFINGISSIVSLYDANMIPVVLNVFQSMFGIMMFVLPVSMVLIGGLKYLNVSYKDWIKYIWKFLIQIFVISLIGSIIFSMIV